MLKNVTAFCLLLFATVAKSQTRLADTALYSQAVANATSTFQQALPLAKEIYTGPEHFGYLPIIEGFAYFGASDWQTGSVLYDGILYENQRLKYDLVADKLVLRRYDGFAIELRSDKVEQFTLPGHTFIYWDGGAKSTLKPGFYDRLAAGPLTMLARYTKVIVDRTEDAKLSRSFTNLTSYYAVKDGQVHSIRNWHSVVSLLGAQRTAVQRYLRKQGLKFSNNREATLAAAANFYNNPQP
jgi:hypothetical protein